MLNEQKVKRMTRLALYEETQGKEDLRICEYYKKDYVGVHVISSVIWVTIGFVALAALIFLAGFDALVASLSNQMIVVLGLIVIVGFFGLQMVYGVLTASICGKRYKEAKRRVKQYNHNLIQLMKWYKTRGRR